MCQPRSGQGVPIKSRKMLSSGLLTRRLYTMPELASALEWIKTRLDGQFDLRSETMVAEENKVAVQLESFATTVEGEVVQQPLSYLF